MKRKLPPIEERMHRLVMQCENVLCYMSTRNEHRRGHYIIPAAELRRLAKLVDREPKP